MNRAGWSGLVGAMFRKELLTSRGSKFEVHRFCNGIVKVGDPQVAGPSVARCEAINTMLRTHVHAKRFLDKWLHEVHQYDANIQA